MTSIVARYKDKNGRDRSQSFTDRFTVGRDSNCDVAIESTEISRRHVEVYNKAGIWWVEDLGSSNGTFCNGERIERARIDSITTLQLAKSGPTLTLELDATEVDRRTNVRESGPNVDEADPNVKAPAIKSLDDRASTKPDETFKQEDLPRRARESSAEPSDLRAHYVDGSSTMEAGDRTLFIRKQFQEQDSKHGRQKLLFLVGAIGVAIVAFSIAAFISYSSRQELNRVRERADGMFYAIKDLDLVVRQLRQEDGAVGLEEVRETIKQRKEDYEAFVVEFGIRRPLDDEELLIHQVARDFNESETEMPARFIREVRVKIKEFWQKEGRQTFITAIQRARSERYTETIADAFRTRDLPVDFFYLGLQESVFDRQAVGTPTNYGFAKGMWQFIPATAQNYGLRLGPEKARAVYDPEDDRHDFEKSTRAAAEYIDEIYVTLAQASGLLAMASYNWGEHRIVKRLPDPDSFAGIERTTRERSYWNFYEKYRDRMPEETKDYVIKIFSAAVIGRDPRRFGFDFDDPLAQYRP